MARLAADRSKEGAVPWQNRTVQVVLASTLLAPLGVPLVAPALPVVRDVFALSDAEASLLVSAYFLVGIVVSPFVGVLADSVGRKRVLVPALLVFSITGLACFFAPNYTVLLVLRAIQGTAAAALFVTTVTVIGDVFEGVQRNAVLGANIAVLSLGAAVFPVLGGALATVAWNTPFLAYVFGFPVALFAYVALDETVKYPPEEEHAPGEVDDTAVTTEQTGEYIRGVLSALTLGMGALLVTAFLTEFFLFGALVTALPFLLTALYDVGPLYIGIVLMVAEAGAIVAASANGRLARLLSNGRIITLGFVCYAVALAGVFLAPSAPFVIAAVLVFGAGLGLSMPAVDAAVSERVTQEFRAGLLGLRNSTTFLGRATGPVVFAAAATTVGYRPLMVVAAITLGAAAMVAAVSTRGSVPGIEVEPDI
ncbi:MFS transporter [Haloferax sp. MBLA0076]|uniref:MFS transporter n=1 Tax=Haloferax litoreum TaxID=2666140 RepID=A0A6A8GJ68_9EURY|nr:MULTISPECIES: MFS transporter [Haloferax]KAB1193649.1 MFS transporter [Haloferax sp. CBA1148]MRX22177.1 MFS transporter [Haloferax litoreum]